MKGSISLIFGLICTFVASAQCPASKKSTALIRELGMNHYQPLQLNTENSHLLMVEFFLQVDPHRVLFDQSDIDEFAKSSVNLLDTNSTSVCAFMDNFMKLYEERFVFVEAQLKAFSNQEANFSAKEQVQFYLLPRRIFEPNQTARIERIHRLYNYELLATAYRQKAEDESLKNYLNRSGDQIKSELPSNMLCNWQLVKNTNRAELIDALLRAIALLHDPHTVFFDAEEVAAFESDLSGDAKTIGIYFERDDQGNLLIGSMLPGSSAWKSNRINEGDKVLSLKTGDFMLNNFSCLDIAEIENKVNLSASNTVEMDIEKSGGERIKVTLMKEIANVEENVISASILKNDMVSVGYIALPAFYSSISNFEDNGCANDLAKEIHKLSKDGIQALILDLRYNGGGDMHEATEIAGLFIDVGPIGMYADKSGKISILKEMNRGVIYAGPLVIMVNGFSASASEIIAAAMQDYNRAVIVGTQTFGKSTAQQINALPIDKTTGKPIGYIKETVAMMHRITGDTHQALGVTPDVVINSHLSEIKINESTEPRALRGAKVNKELT